MAKEKKELTNKELFDKVLNVVLWTILIIWMAITLWDFTLVKQNKSPKFCIKTAETEHIDGTTHRCLGPMYQVFRYNRESIKAIEFTHIFAKEKFTDN